ncbi:hypothetical protein LDENG_00131090 [Lucifuga dentata]|nr:hypothetical protein LDENG_00131090 [Lucifuga dentata]
MYHVPRISLFNNKNHYGCNYVLMDDYNILKSMCERNIFAFADYVEKAWNLRKHALYQ